MNMDAAEQAALVQRAKAGDEHAAQQLFALHRERLKRMVHLRLSRRLEGRVADSDVLLEAFGQFRRHIGEFDNKPGQSLFLWLRQVAGNALSDVHRRALGTMWRDPDREVTLHRGGLPAADSMSLAAHLLGKWKTPPPEAVKAEARLTVQNALNNMDAIDREVLALKHFEQLTTGEIAEILQASVADVGRRYLSAIKRLNEILSKIPGFMPSA